MSYEQVEKVAAEIAAEAGRAIILHPSMKTAHDGYAVLLEEVDELWDEVKKNPRKDPDTLRRRRVEAIQIAAMALRFVIDVCDV